jgi:predicted transcriptional regulator
MKTTIQVEEEVKKMLEELKIHPKESYNLVIKRLTKSKIDEEPLSKETVEAIERGLKDIKEGRFYSTEEVKKRLNINEV